MKKIILSISAICLSIFVNAQNGAHIEYKISSSKGSGGTMAINYSEFGHISEFSMVVPQMPGGGIVTRTLMMKSTPDVYYIINEKNKTYSEMQKKESQTQDNKTYTVKKIGEETVNGYKCVHALVTEGKETYDIWNTKDIKDFAKYSDAFASNKQTGSMKREQALKDAGCDGLPVKMVHKGNEKQGDMTMELIKVEKKTFSKSDFEIPAGYSKSAGGSAVATGAMPGMKSQDEIMKMTPEERAKWAEEMKKMYGNGKK